MNYSTRIIRNLGCLTLILSTNLLGTSAFAFGRAHNVPSHPTPVPMPIPTPVPVSTPRPQMTPRPAPSPVHANSTCVSTDPEHMCMGVRMESYTQNGNPVLNEIQAEVLIAGINKIWAPCNIAFQLEKYEAVNPTKLGLDYDVNWEVDGDTVREQFQEKDKFLVVSVGQLTGPTIGVTEMPGTGIYGALIHEDYAQNESTVGHELGHYMGLYHVNSTRNLMAANMGPGTDDLTRSQCATARETNQSDWTAMMRH